MAELYRYTSTKAYKNIYFIHTTRSWKLWQIQKCENVFDIILITGMHNNFVSLFYSSVGSIKSIAINCRIFGNNEL